MYRVGIMDQKTDKIYSVRASDYKLYEEVGHGVSASVYRALCIPFNVIVVVKVLDLEKCNSNLDGIRREVQTMSLIDHPNILKAHCSFTADHSLWVVMPYMSGGSCLNIMKSAYPDGFEEAVIATFLREALKALEYLHRHGHIHRDIKAGNILVNGNGAIKLGDFGVSAFLFDSGNRQRSRNTFVGTPCWMAPEVMEQLHGYDFKADIWSFGITALELAHGNAPFSKYPPMKVLLMTLQNAPPGLDYQRDKKFSKSFKEMVAMCLVKDPTKRPSAAKLLKHRFFKHARSNDYIVRTVLDGLPPLGERLRTLKLREMDRMGPNKMAYGEKEEKSQSEYIRGISAWNFDLEDLKAQAALIQDEAEIPSVKEQPEDSKTTDGSSELMRLLSHCDSLSSICSLRMENTGKDGGHDIHAGPTPLSSLPKSINVLKEQFEVIDDDIHACSPTQEESINEECTISAKVGKQDSNKDHKSREDVYHAPVHGRRVLSAPLVPERVLASGDGEREKHQRRHQQRSFSGPLITRGRTDIDNSHEPSKPLEEKLVGPFVQQKGRFKVTTEDVNLKESTSKHPSLAPSSNVAILPTSAIIRPLQNIFEQNTMQREQIINLIKHMKQEETPSVQQYSNLGLQASNLGATENSRVTVQQHSNLGLQASILGSTENSRLKAFSDQEHVLLQQVAELQNRVGNLVDELQRLKIRNIQLERQLNAAFNREKEARNKKEAALHDL